MGSVCPGKQRKPESNTKCARALTGFVSNVGSFIRKGEGVSRSGRGQSGLLPKWSCGVTRTRRGKKNIKKATGGTAAL